jgi:hypothetical protein
MEAQDLILFVDQERRRQKLTQMGITDKAGVPDTGQRYYRMWAAMDGKISTCLGYLHALGYDITISKREVADGEEQGV